MDNVIKLIIIIVIFTVTYYLLYFKSDKCEHDWKLIEDNKKQITQHDWFQGHDYKSNHTIRTKIYECEKCKNIKEVSFEL